MISWLEMPKSSILVLSLKPCVSNLEMVALSKHCTVALHITHIWHVYSWQGQWTKPFKHNENGMSKAIHLF